MSMLSKKIKIIVEMIMPRFKSQTTDTSVLPGQQAVVSGVIVILELDHI